MRFFTLTRNLMASLIPEVLSESKSIIDGIAEGYEFGTNLVNALSSNDKERQRIQRKIVAGDRQARRLFAPHSVATRSRSKRGHLKRNPVHPRPKRVNNSIYFDRVKRRRPIAQNKRARLASNKTVARSPRAYFGISKRVSTRRPLGRRPFELIRSYRSRRLQRYRRRRPYRRRRRWY